jgi:hypothetical protein
MNSLKANIDFVNKLLNTKGISDRQRFTILNLFKLEMVEYEQLLLDINSDVSKKDVGYKTAHNSFVKEKDKLTHNPLKVVEILKLFTTSDTFKYITHSWDRRKDGKEVVDRKTFATTLSSEFKKNNFYQLKNLGLVELYWTIYNFLFVDYEKENLFNTKKGWAQNYEPKLPKGFKFGWGCSKFIEFYSNNQSNYMDYEIPKTMRPVIYTTAFNDTFRQERNLTKNGRDYLLKKTKLTKEDKHREIVKLESNLPIPSDDDVEEIIPIDELSFRYFEDFVTIFKKQIEFRNNDFHNLILSEFSKQDRIDIILKMEGLKGLDIYTDTARIKAAIEKIAWNTLSSSRDKGKEIKISSSFSLDNSYVTIDIHHVGSFSNAHIDSNPKLNLREKAGDIWQIRDYLLSLCDFSIISTFKDKDGVEKPMEIEYLSKERAVIGGGEEQFRTIELSEKPLGFTYRLKFYL